MFFGWRVVAAAVAVFAYGNAVYGPGVWQHVLTAERGWSVAFVSACVTLHFLASAGGPSASQRSRLRCGDRGPGRAVFPPVLHGGPGPGAAGWFLKPHVDRRRAAAWSFLVQADGNLTLLLSVAGWPRRTGAAGRMRAVRYRDRQYAVPAAGGHPGRMAANQVPEVVAAMLLGGAFSLLRDGLGDWAAAGAALALQLTAAPLVRGTASVKPAT